MLYKSEGFFKFLFAFLFMKTLLTLLVFLSLSLFSLAWSSDQIKAQKGQTFYTLFSFYYEDYSHLTTNYRKGVLVPINTPVKFLEADEEEIVVEISAKKVKIVNVPAYSGENISHIFSRTFGSKPVNLDKFTGKERENIAAGTVAPGMSKEAVICALGYPPKHKTPALTGDHWRYWHNRFGTFLVWFNGNTVSRIQE